MRTVITYGTFDLFHIGHVKLLERAKSLGDRLIVGVSADEFNELKGKRSVFPYEQRAAIVASLRMVDHVLPERDWAQKVRDIQEHKVDVFVIGDDWSGKFDDLKAHCEVVYLPRTEGISTTALKKALSSWNAQTIAQLHEGLDALKAIAAQLGE